MVKRIITASFLIVQILMLLTGCTPGDPKPGDDSVAYGEPIKVTVKASAKIWPQLSYDANAIFEFTKDGGEPFTIIRKIPPGGTSENGEVGYDLRPGEVIQVTAKVQGREASAITYGDAVPYLYADDTITYDSAWSFSEYGKYTWPFVFTLTVDNPGSDSPIPVVTTWNLTGKWILRVSVEGGSTYTHDYDITQTDSSLEGSGGVPAGGSYDNRETISGTNGMTANGPITMHSDYDNGTYTYYLTGTIDKDGKLSGTWVDNYNPQHKGTFTTISGAAKPFH